LDEAGTVLKLMKKDRFKSNVKIAMQKKLANIWIEKSTERALEQER
jgi:hypothetical protein